MTSIKRSKRLPTNLDQLESFISQIQTKPKALVSSVPRVISPAQFQQKQPTRFKQIRITPSLNKLQQIQQINLNISQMEFNQPNYFEQDQLKLEQSLIYQNNKLNLTHIICNFYIKKKALERQKVRFESGGILVNTDEVIFKKIKIMLNKKSTKNNENYTQYIYQIFKTDKKFCLEWFQNRIQIINLLQQYMLKFTEKSCITIQRKNGIYF